MVYICCRYVPNNNNDSSITDTGTAVGFRADAGYSIADSSRTKRFHRHYTGNRHYCYGTIESSGTVQPALWESPIA